MEEVLVAGESDFPEPCLALPAIGLPVVVRHDPCGCRESHRVDRQLPLIYLLGLFLIASAYGIFHRNLADNNQRKWAVIGTGFYVLFAPQMYWALARVRDGSWGTRAA